MVIVARCRGGGGKELGRVRGQAGRVLRELVASPAGELLFREFRRALRLAALDRERLPLVLDVHSSRLRDLAALIQEALNTEAHMPPLNVSP
jgi:hypothetical protein